MSDDREDRIEALYQGWGARDMAERIVDLEDARDAYRASDKANRAASLKRWEWLMLTIKHRDRYRLAWTSARRRASMEANFAAEALVANEADLRGSGPSWRRSGTSAAGPWTARARTGRT